MVLDIPIWARLAIMAAWAVLKRVLANSGFPDVVITAIEDVLRHFGILGMAKHTAETLESRATALREHCSGVACAPDLKG